MTTTQTDSINRHYRKPTPISWAWQKAALLFLGLVTKGIAFSEPLPFYWGVSAKAIAGVIWPAFDGAFLWLLTPPTQPIPKEDPDDTCPTDTTVLP